MTVISKVRQTLASLKSTQAGLMFYEAHSQNEETRRAYGEALDVTDAIVKDLENRIKTLEDQEPQYKDL